MVSAGLMTGTDKRKKNVFYTIISGIVSPRRFIFPLRESRILPRRSGSGSAPLIRVIIQQDGEFCLTKAGITDMIILRGIWR